MRLRFTKMHGLGNDFVMIDGISQKINLTPERVRKLADRNFGVGCDQVLLVEPPQTPNADFRYRIYNQDGGEVENCGNGARCFAAFVRQRGLTVKNKIEVETTNGNLVLHVHEDNRITVDMGVPVLEPEKIPFKAANYASIYPLEAGGRSFEISAVSMGNPHSVTLVDDVESFPVERFGPLIEKHKHFPKRVNAGFLQILSRREAKLRVFERGVGETLACGTGACAAMVAGRLRQLLDHTTDIHLPGGTLTLTWEGQGKPVMMTGPAVSVFQGQIKL
ncbi:diaminopimelate epimerase [Agarilytica rhodophyticola]|uniref:diaminopimelate epimerase n=1 Tax=Agarilytica rhodophyticola TaxID=1737490 RepID=UPI000B34766F|nr:diaminopimelate epimerase [Agarilytica rhodophyticola]